MNFLDGKESSMKSKANHSLFIPEILFYFVEPEGPSLPSQ
jgi:hypothetical protein